MSYINPGAFRSLASLPSATSANGTARNGTAVQLNTVHPGTLTVLCVGSITTSSVTASYKWQVSQDNSTFYDLKPMNNASGVATSAGTGSPVAHSFVLDCPQSVVGWKWIRPVATLTGAATDTADVTACTVYWMQVDDVIA